MHNPHLPFSISHTTHTTQLSYHFMLYLLIWILWSSFFSPLYEQSWCSIFYCQFRKHELPLYSSLQCFIYYLSFYYIVMFAWVVLDHHVVSNMKFQYKYLAGGTATSLCCFQLYLLFEKMLYQHSKWVLEQQHLVFCVNIGTNQHF